MLLLLFLTGCFFSELGFVNKGPREEISQAIKEGNGDELLSILERPWPWPWSYLYHIISYISHSGVDINELDEMGFAPIHEAVYLGNESALEILTEHGANLNILTGQGRGENSSGLTPLMLAVIGGHYEICEVLLKKYSDVDIGDSYGQTALVHAVVGGHKEICKLLLSVRDGCYSVHSIDRAGKTALMHAAEHGKKEVCELVLESAYNVHRKQVEWLRNRQNYKILYMLYGSIEGDDNRIKDYVQKYVDCADEKGRTALMLAAENGRKEVCELLLSMGANSSMEAALNLAVANGHEDICRLVLCRGLKEWTAEDRELIGEKVIERAVWDGHFGICKCILNTWKISAKSVHMRKIMKDAVVGGHLSVCKLLLDLGCNANTELDGGKTALIYAVEEEHQDVCTLLLKRGGNSNFRVQSGETALIIAMKRGYEAIFDILLESKLDGYSIAIFNEKGFSYLNEHHVTSILSKGMFDKFFRGKYAEVASFLPVAFLIENFIGIAEMNARRFNSLHFASISSDSRALELVLEHGRALDFVNNDDNEDKLLPLRLALKHGRLQNAKILLAHGALPLYISRNWWGSEEHNLLEESPELEGFLKNEALFFLLGHSKADLAGKLITCSEKVSYADIVNLGSNDEKGMNAYHYLASYCCDDVAAVWRFLSGSKNLKSFRKELLYQYDNEGLTPLHRAILASNAHFIKYLAILGLLSTHELTIRTQKENFSVLGLVLHRPVDKEAIEAITKYIITNHSDGMENLHEVLTSGNAESKAVELKSFPNGDEGISFRMWWGNVDILESIIALDDIMFLSYMVQKSSFDAEHAFSLALAFSSKRVLDLLCDTFSRIDVESACPIRNSISKTNLHDLCIGGKEASVRVVLHFNADRAVERNEEGELPIHVAAKRGRTEIVKILLEYAEVLSSINSINKKGQNAIHYAVSGFSLEVISLLIESGCGGVVDKDIDGKRPIDLLTVIKPRNKEEQERKTSVIHFLLNAAEGVRYEPVRSDSIMDLAIRQNETGVIKELLRE